MRQLDTCPIHEEYYEPDPPRPRPHLMVKRSSSDSVKELHVIHKENNLYQSDMSIGTFQILMGKCITQHWPDYNIVTIVYCRQWLW